MKELVKLTNDFLGITNEISAPIIITLITFFISLSLTNIGLIFKRYRDRRIYRRVIKNAALRLNKQIIKQSQEFKKSSDNISFKNDVGFKFGRVQLLSIETFESIGYKKAVESYLIGAENLSLPYFNKDTIKTKALDKLWESILSIHYWHDKFISDTNIFLEKYNQYNESRNNAIDQYNQIYLRSVNEANENHVRELEYLRKITEIRKDWVGLVDNNRADICHEQLVIPIRKISENYSDLKIAIEINLVLLRASHEYTNQSNTVDFNKKLFLNYSINFRNYSRIISKCIQILDRCYE